MIDTLSTLEQAVLLDRPVRPLLDDLDRRRFAGRSVLITGAGGSIGSQLARQVADCQVPQRRVGRHDEQARRIAGNSRPQRDAGVWEMEIEIA